MWYNTSTFNVVMTFNILTSVKWLSCIFLYLFRLSSLVNNSKENNSIEEIQYAVYDVLDKYTFFEDAHKTLDKWENADEGVIQKKIVNEHTHEIPNVLRMV